MSQFTPSDAGLRSHYPTPGAKCADLVVHIVGLVLALIGGIVLVALAVSGGSLSRVVSIVIYALGVVAMLGFSTAYNFAKAPYQPVLQHLDHVGIFLMIACSYTPFTVRLPGPWAVGMTAAVWSIATIGAIGRLVFRSADRRLWVGVYLALGWLIVVALKPLIAHLAWYALLLLLAGGVLYSTGVIFFINERLKFARAIWHGHVVAAAAAHWTAVLLGVVLTTH